MEGKLFWIGPKGRRARLRSGRVLKFTETGVSVEQHCGVTLTEEEVKNCLEFKMKRGSPAEFAVFELRGEKKTKKKSEGGE